MKRKALIEARKQAKFTQRDLSEKTGIARSYLGLIESGARNPTLPIAANLAQALKRDISDLFPGEVFFANKCYDTKHYML